MRALLILAAPALTLWLCYCLWRTASLLTSWRPAAATVWSSDYSEAERQDDRWGFGTLRGWNWRDGKGSRLIEQDVQFDDESGTRRRVTIEHRVPRGWTPDGAFVIWYQRADPAKVTAFGPGGWVLQAVCIAAALVSIFAAGSKLVH